MTHKPRAGERWFALALFAFGLTALWQAYGISSLSSLSSAGVFPMLASAIMVIASGTIVIKTRAAPTASTAGRAGAFGELLPARLILFLSLVVGFLAAMPTLGFMPAAALFLYVAIAMLWRRGLIKPALVTAVALVVIFVTFRLAFQIVLPRGTLIPQLL